MLTFYGQFYDMIFMNDCCACSRGMLTKKMDMSKIA